MGLGAGVVTVGTLALALASPPARSGTVFPFTIPGEGPAEVHATVDDVRCIFLWQPFVEETAPAIAPPESTPQEAPSGPSKAVSLRMLAAIAGQCSGSDGAASAFSYTVCVGSKVTQAAGGDAPFSLGTLNVAASAQLDPLVEVFTGGDLCGAISRATRVIYSCGASFAVVEASEPSTCQYLLLVTHPALCNVPPEEVAAGVSPSPTPPPTPPAADKPLSRDDILRRSVALLRAERSRERMAAGGAGGAAAPLPPASGDVPGVGGATLGLDDSRRRGLHWAGLGDLDAPLGSAAAGGQPNGGGGGGGGGIPWTAVGGGGGGIGKMKSGAVAAAASAGAGGGPPSTSTWALELHHTWPAGLLQRGTGAGSSEGGAAAGGAFTCSVYETDDMRKGTVGNAEERAHVGRAALLVLTSASGSDTAPALVRVAARGPGRRVLPLALAPPLQAGPTLLPGQYGFGVAAATPGGADACAAELRDSAWAAALEAAGVPAALQGGWACAAVVSLGPMRGSGGSGGLPLEHVTATVQLPRAGR